MKKYLFIASILGNIAVAGGIPGGINRTAENFAPRTYEMLLSPSFTLSPNGGYLASELRYQTTEDLGAGVGFGAGEIGFNVGAYAVWHALPELSTQPALGLIGGLYLNRNMGENYFVVKLAPIVSKRFQFEGWSVSPYVSTPIAPSFRLSQPNNQVGIKLTGGSQFQFNSLGGLKVWTEMGVGVSNSEHNLSLGVSYPFDAIGG